MTYNPDIHHRHSIRLKGYDYSRQGLYFVTICIQNRKCLFGEIINDAMILNECGQIVQMVWDELPQHYANIQLDKFVIMPNHVHGIILIDHASVGAGFKPAQISDAITNHANEIDERAGLKPAPTKKHGLPEIVRALKTFSAKKLIFYGILPAKKCGNAIIMNILSETRNLI
jgi:REP element-mobilizing transposase RayT